MTTSRDRLLEYIQAHYPLTAPEISHALRMTQANARHHLNILIQEGLVEVIGKRPPSGKGRPLLLYNPSSNVLGDNLATLALALLDEYFAEIPETQHFAALQRVATRMAAQLPAPGKPPTHLTHRLTQAVQHLNTWHYQARWEAHTNGPRLVLGHCPFTAMLSGHPQLCSLDALLLEGMLGIPVEQVARLENDRRGMPICVFRIAA